MFNVKKILVPVDFSNGSRHALRHAFDLAERLGAEVQVLHVWEQPFFAGREPRIQEGSTTSLSEYALNLAREEMNRFVSELSPKVPVSTEVAIGRPRERILEQAADGNFDLIVMGTAGRTGRARSMAGSVAESVVRTAPCPVLTVREP
ncbi:MAG: universal stress protein [Pseudomonadota bacterium]|nr:MAG: universal stress protein [Pseudomonadota bacterium]